MPWLALTLDRGLCKFIKAVCVYVKDANAGTKIRKKSKKELACSTYTHTPANGNGGVSVAVLSIL